MEKENIYHGFRHSGEIISHTVWLYSRFTLSFRDVEEILAYRRIDVSYESLRRWCYHLGQDYSKKIRAKQGQAGDTWYLDEVFIKIKGKLHHLWRAVDQDGDTLDILVQSRKNKNAAERFFRKLLKGLKYSPNKIVTDKLKSYGAAHREMRLSAVHETASTKTIGLKIHTNEHVNKNGKCDDSNQRGTLNDVSLFTEQLIISRAKTAISYHLAPIVH
jgi:putative transposase